METELFKFLLESGIATKADIAKYLNEAYAISLDNYPSVPSSQIVGIPEIPLAQSCPSVTPEQSAIEACNSRGPLLKDPNAQESFCRSSDPSLSITACELRSSEEEGNSLSTDGVLCSELFEALLGSYSLTVTETQQLADLIARLSSPDRSLLASILSNNEATANA